MNSRTKKVLVVLGILWGIPLIATLALGLWIKSMGMLSVEVSEHRPGGSNVQVHVPGALASLGLAVLPKEVCAEVADNIDDRWGPLVHALEGELNKCPDATFVEVTGPRENVSIRKSGIHLMIDVDSSEETVHLKVPVAVVAGILDKIDGHVNGARCRMDRARVNRFVERIRTKSTGA